MDRLRSELHQTKIELHTTFQLWKEQQQQFHNERDEFILQVDNLTKENKKLKKKIETNEEKFNKEKNMLLDDIKEAEEMIERLRKYGDIQTKINDAILEKSQNNHDVHMQTMKKVKAVLRIPILTKKFHDLIQKENMDEFDSLDLVYRKHFDLVGEQNESMSPPQKMSKVQRHLVQLYRTPFTPVLSGSDSITGVTSMNATQNTLANMNSTFKKLRNTMINNRHDLISNLQNRLMTQDEKHRSPKHGERLASQGYPDQSLGIQTM